MSCISAGELTHPMSTFPISRRSSFTARLLPLAGATALLLGSIFVNPGTSYAAESAPTAVSAVPNFWGFFAGHAEQDKQLARQMGTLLKTANGQRSKVVTLREINQARAVETNTEAARSRRANWLFQVWSASKSPRVGANDLFLMYFSGLCQKSDKAGTRLLLEPQALNDPDPGRNLISPRALALPFAALKGRRVVLLLDTNMSRSFGREWMVEMAGEAPGVEATVVGQEDFPDGKGASGPFSKAMLEFMTRQVNNGESVLMEALVHHLRSNASEGTPAVFSMRTLQAPLALTPAVWQRSVFHGYYGVQDDPALKLEITSGAELPKVGKKMVFGVQCPQKGYLVVLEKGTSGNVNLLHPTSPSLEEARCEPGSVRVPRSGFSFAPDGVGTESLRAHWFEKEEDARDLLRIFAEHPSLTLDQQTGTGNLAVTTPKGKISLNQIKFDVAGE